MPGTPPAQILSAGARAGFFFAGANKAARLFFAGAKGGTLFFAGANKAARLFCRRMRNGTRKVEWLICPRAKSFGARELRLALLLILEQMLEAHQEQLQPGFKSLAGFQLGEVLDDEQRPAVLLR